MPALSPTCQMRSDVIQWSDDNPNTSYYMVTLFHSSIRCQSISYLIDTTNHPQVISVNLDNLTRHLPLHCQNLQTSYLAVQRCASNAPACGLVSECLPADYCAQGMCVVWLQLVSVTADHVALNAVLLIQPTIMEGYCRYRSSNRYVAVDMHM